MLESFTNKLLSLIGLGYVGILIFMAIESSFIPFPSEVVLIPAGMLVAEGKLNFWEVLTCATLGSLIGAWLNYWLGYYLGRNLFLIAVEKYGKFILLKKNALYKAEMFFNKYGVISTLVGRLVPVVRQFISLPAGFAQMNFFWFSISTAIGAAFWSTFLILTGIAIRSTLNYFSIWLILLIVTIILVSYFTVQSNIIKLKK